MSRPKEMPRWASFFFLIIGAYIVAISLGLLPYTSRSKGRAIFDDPQHWQVTSFGIAFFCAGIAIAFSKSRHWLLSIVGVILVASLVAPLCWVAFHSGVVSAPMKILWAIILAIGSIGAVLGILRKAGLLKNRFPTVESSANMTDPIREAELYLAYGRTAQAIDVLKAAIRHTPSRSAEFQMKIDEIGQNS